jgi:hypothetical protein
VLPPAFPAGFVDRLPAFFVAACLLWTTANTLGVNPHQVAYINEAAGGPENGHEHDNRSTARLEAEFILRDESRLATWIPVTVR